MYWHFVTTWISGQIFTMWACKIWICSWNWTEREQCKDLSALRHFSQYLHLDWSGTLCSITSRNTPVTKLNWLEIIWCNWDTPHLTLKYFKNAVFYAMPKIQWYVWLYKPKVLFWTTKTRPAQAERLKITTNHLNLALAKIHAMLRKTSGILQHT